MLKLTQEIPKAHKEYIWCIKFHPFENIFASCGNDKIVSIFEYSPLDKKYIKTSILSKTHKKTIRSLNWDYSGNYLSLASMDSTISIWKIIEKKPKLKFICISILEGHENEVKSVSFSPSGKYLSSCSRDKTIWIWDIEENNINDYKINKNNLNNNNTENNNIEKNINNNNNENINIENNNNENNINNNDIIEFSCNSVLHGHSQDIKMVKFSPREDILFSCSFDNSIKIWKFSYEIDDWDCIKTLTEHKGTVWCIDFNKNGNKFISCSDDKMIILYGIDFSLSNSCYENILILKKIENCHERFIYSVSFFFDNNYFVSGGGDNKICVYKIDDNNFKKIYEKNAFDYDVNCVNCKKNENLIGSCSDDGNIKLWKINFE